MKVRVKGEQGGTRLKTIYFIRIALILTGLAALGYVGYVYADAELYQRYENWAFDQEMQGRAPSVPSFLAHASRVDSIFTNTSASDSSEDVTRPAEQRGNASAAATVQRPAAKGADRTLIGRIEIPRLNVRAIVREGDDDRTLRRAVGHVPYTALPGKSGNVALAGHRDTFFRGLKGVRKNDKISIRTLDGDYQYAVESVKIVHPTDVNVLAPTDENVLTLVTCYPFNYVGEAPKRYIVRAKQLNVAAKTSATQAASLGGAQ